MMATSSRNPKLDSGWAWVILLATSTIHFLWSGLTKSFSVLLPTLQDQFQTHTWIIGFMVASMQTIRDVSSPIVGAFANNVDNRILVVAGGTIAALAIINTSFVTTVIQLIVLVSVVTGTAFSFVMVPCNLLLTQYFDKFYPMAVAVFYSCGALGVMAFAPLTQLFLDTYGWRNALLLLGAILCHVVVLGSLLRPHSPIGETCEFNTNKSNIGHAFTPLNQNNENTDAFGWMSDSTDSSKKKKSGHIARLFGLSLWKNVSFLAASVMMGSLCASYTGWIVYFIPHCLVKGMTPYQATSLATIAGFANFLGYFIYVPFVSRNLISVRGAIYLSGIVSAVSLAIDKWTSTFTMILVSNIFYTSGMGVSWSLSDVHLKSIVDQNVLAQALGWRMGFTGVSRMLGGVIVGWMYDQSGSYDGAFFLLGAVQAAGVLAIAADHLRLKMKHRRE